MKATIKAAKFDSAGEAVQNMNAGGGTAILMNGEYLVVSKSDGCRLQREAADGVDFVFLCEDGDRIVTIPAR